MADKIDFQCFDLFVDCKIPEKDTFAGVASEPYLLADGEYFLMGDNRGDSEDSRAYGGVLLEDIRGIITFKLYPFNGF